MKFRFDFGEKLDLSRFKRQAPHYISLALPINYSFYLPHYRMNAEIVTPLDSTAHRVTIHFHEITRDAEGDLASERLIYPINDTRFKEIHAIQDVFMIDNYKAIFESHSSVDTVEKICSLLRVLSKINNLKVFL